MDLESDQHYSSQFVDAGLWRISGIHFALVRDKHNFLFLHEFDAVLSLIESEFSLQEVNSDGGSMPTQEQDS